METETDFQTTHHLPFEIAPWPFPDFCRFKIGTCHGLWGFDQDSFQILAVDNKKPGNGHLQDVFEWFEHSCQRDKKDLMVLEVWNARFKRHLMEKRGFVEVPGTDHVVKKIAR